MENLIKLNGEFILPDIDGAKFTLVNYGVSGKRPFIELVLGDRYIFAYSSNDKIKFLESLINTEIPIKQVKKIKTTAIAIFTWMKEEYEKEDAALLGFKK